MDETIDTGGEMSIDEAPFDTGYTDTTGENQNANIWNPDIGWVDANGNKVEVPVNYGMTPGEDSTSSFGGSFDTADPKFSFDKYVSGDYQYDPSSTNLGNAIAGIIGKVGTSAFNTMKSNFTDKNGNTNWARLATVGGGLLGLLGSNSSWSQPKIQKTGYQGGIPTLTAVRERVPGTYDPNRRAGSAGQQYFTDTQYASPSDVATAKAAAAEQAKQLEAQNKANPAQQSKPVAQYAAGGLANLAKGKYLSGSTDGMADQIPATIGTNQPAKLSHGEFVIPADVVSHLGNGNSDAGAQRLYSMMDKVRKARTGNVRQGKQINPNKFMPG